MRTLKLTCSLPVNLFVTLSVTLSFALSAAGCQKSSAPLPSPESQVCLQAQTLDGKPLCFHEKKGCPVVLKLMASWCETCTSEMQGFNKAFQAIPASQRPTVLIMGVLDSEDALANYQKHAGVPFLFGMDSQGVFQSKFSLMAIPGTTLIDEHGNALSFTDPFTGKPTQLITGPRDWTQESAKSFLKQLCSAKD